MGRDCKYCGAYISSDETVCPACGKRVRPEKDDCDCTYEYSQAAKAQQAAQEREYVRDDFEQKNYEQERRNYEQNNYQQQNHQYTTYKGTVVGSREEDIRRNRAMCYLCYLGPLFLIPYLTVKDSEFVKFHSNQGLLLLIASVIIQAVAGIGILGGLIEAIGSIFILVCFVKGMQNVSRGLMNPLPIIGQFKFLK